MSKLHFEVSRNASSMGVLAKTLNKSSSLLNGQCEEDRIPAMSKTTVNIR